MNKLISLTLAALGLATPASAQIAAFQHIIIVIQENRTPDNFFQGLCTPTAAKPTPCSTQPGPEQYDIQTTGWFDKTSPKGYTNPHKTPLAIGYDMDHVRSGFLAMCDKNASGACAMDGAALVHCNAKAWPCPKAKAAYGFVDPSDVQPDLDIAHYYGWANHFFQTNQGPSLAAHQFLFGATSAPTGADDHNGIFVDGNTPNRPAGCTAEPKTTVSLIDPQGHEDGRVYPCFEHRTLSDLLHVAGVSWRYYGQEVGGIWMAPNAIKHICKAVDGQCTGKEFANNVEPKSSAILSDILTKCKLRGVSWVTPDGKNSDHSGNLARTGGPSWVAQIVNAVGNSTCTDTINGNQVTYWDDTAILITWDDWGGWYDHVQPRIEPYPQGGYQLGFRVPLLVVSAYTSRGYIHNGREDFGSVARFVEHNFGIREGALTFADERATGDLREFFFLGNPPNPFQPISAPLSAQHFIDTPPSGDPPDDD